MALRRPAAGAAVLLLAAVASILVAPAGAVLGGECQPLLGSPGFPGSFELRNRDDMDALLAGCTRMVGNVIIRCDNLDATKSIRDADMLVFADVTEITGYLRIEDCPQITNMRGFASLQNVNGDELYTTPTGQSGNVLIIENNNAMTSLAGLESLRTLRGGGTVGHGRVIIRNNDQLCFLNNVNWASLLGASWDRLVTLSEGSAANCAAQSCSPACSCDVCFGPDSSDCQGSCPADDDDDLIIMWTIIGFVILCVIVLIIFFCCTGRCGCRLRVDDNIYRLGRVKSDAAKLAETSGGALARQRTRKRASVMDLPPLARPVVVDPFEGQDLFQTDNTYVETPMTAREDASLPAADPAAPGSINALRPAPLSRVSLASGPDMDHVLPSQVPDPVETPLAQPLVRRESSSSSDDGGDQAQLLRASRPQSSASSRRLPDASALEADA